MTRDLLPLVLVLLPLTAAAALSDLRTGLIPNRLVALGLLAGSTARLVAQALSVPVEPWGALAQSVGGSVLGACVCGSAPYLLFRLGAMGGGDVKLLAAVGAGAGAALGLRVELLAFIVAALYALVRVAVAGQLLPLLVSSASLLARPFSALARRPSPSVDSGRAEATFGALRFAPAIFLATLLVAAECWGRG